VRRQQQQQTIAATTAEVMHGAPATGMAAELAGILASSNARLLDLQREAADIAFAEAAAVQAAWLQAMTAMAELLPQASDRANTMRFIDITNAWLQVVTQAQMALIELVGQAARAEGRPTASDRPEMVERRKTAVVINFPDRRHAA
jgi:hypothetical protein